MYYIDIQSHILYENISRLTMTDPISKVDVALLYIFLTAIRVLLSKASVNSEVIEHSELLTSTLLEEDSSDDSDSMNDHFL